MSIELKNRTALITGAGRGIGRAIALRLAGEGMNLSLTARSEEELEAVKLAAASYGSKIFLFPGDLSDSNFPARVIKNTAEHFGGLDILVNNAGIASGGPAENTSLDDWNKHINVNATAPFLLCKEALPCLRKSSSGTIINISSVVGHRGYANQCAYTASKHALAGFTKALAGEVREDGIRVHLISPGGVATDMVKKTRPDLDETILISPEDIAETVFFLLSLRNTNAVIDDIRLRRASGVPWG